jgi:hypothetical protein
MVIKSYNENTSETYFVELSPGYLTIMSRMAGVMRDKVDMQIAPEREMKRSRSGTNKANATETIFFIKQFFSLERI